MLSDQELQSLRNWGNLAEEAADEICALRAALAAQPAEPVAHLYQHGKTGRTRIVPVDAVADCDASWDLVGPLVLAAPAAVPPGWKLVPIKPTPEMVDAYLKANAAYWERIDQGPPKIGVWRNGTPREATAEAYHAMIAAAGDKP